MTSATNPLVRSTTPTTESTSRLSTQDHSFIFVELQVPKGSDGGPRNLLCLIEVLRGYLVIPRNRTPVPCRYLLVHHKLYICGPRNWSQEKLQIQTVRSLTLNKQFKVKDLPPTLFSCNSKILESLSIVLSLPMYDFGFLPTC